MKHSDLPPPPGGPRGPSGPHPAVRKMLRVERDPECRWCRRQGPFSEQPIAVLSVCTECGAIQPPVMKFGNVEQSFEIYYNPDNSLYFEVSKLMGKSVRYIVEPEKLKVHGAFLESMTPLEGKRYGG